MWRREWVRQYGSDEMDNVEQGSAAEARQYHMTPERKEQRKKRTEQQRKTVLSITRRDPKIVDQEKDRLKVIMLVTIMVNKCTLAGHIRRNDCM